MVQSFEIVFVSSHILPKNISRPQNFIAEDDGSLKMVGFNVIFYVRALAFFSTHFANKANLKMSIGIIVLASGGLRLEVGAQRPPKLLETNIFIYLDDSRISKEHVKL